MVTQTAEIPTTTPDGGAAEKTPQSAFTAAMEYAEHGWPVLPGSTWNGRRYQIPGTNRITDGVRPTVPRNYATTRGSTITEWWGLRGPLVPTVLLRSGLAFDVLSVARPLAELVIKHTAFCNNAGPVAFRPDKGRAYFMVTPGEIPATGFGGDPGEIVLMESGSWILVPPARLSPGVNAVWLVTPEHVGWKLATFEIVRDVLSLVVKNRALVPPPTL